MSWKHFAKKEEAAVKGEKYLEKSKKNVSEQTEISFILLSQTFISLYSIPSQREITIIFCQ